MITNCRIFILACKNHMQRTTNFISSEAHCWRRRLNVDFSCSLARTARLQVIAYQTGQL